MFAEGKNLDLINTDAVKAAIEQQQKQLSGQASLKALFGITDENLQQQSEQLGQGLAAVFGGASETDAVKGAGAAIMGGITAGLSDPGAASTAVAGMANAMKTAQGTPENQTALYDNGYGAYAAWSKGGSSSGAAPIVPPRRRHNGTCHEPSRPQSVPASGRRLDDRARQRDTLRPGTEVRNAREGGRGGTVVNNYVTIASQIDEEAFLRWHGGYGGQANGARA